MPNEGQTNGDIAISIEGVSKSFGGVKALREVNVRVKRGTIHALVGENGAGKSTLMNILAGIHQRDAGQILIDGNEVYFNAPSASQAAGVAIIHQELALAPDLTVAENMFLGDLGLGSKLVPWKELNKRSSDALTMFGFSIDPKVRVGDLSVAYQQIIEIAKSLVVHKSKILILDEPTAVLADPEIDILFKNLRRLRDSGVTVIYISHRLEEIFRIADAITVIKDGQTITDLDPRECTEDDIISNMVGRKLESLFPPKKSIDQSVEPFLAVKGLHRNGVLNEVNLEIRRGEIVGIAGLVGSGRSEIVRSIFGIDARDEGEIIKDGVSLKIRRPIDAIRHGIALVPEDRKREGGILQIPICRNITMSNHKRISRFGIVNRAKEGKITETMRDRLQIKLGHLSDPLSSLSGGNQQKVVLAKWLSTDCDMLILDEPTRGVDVGAKAEIYSVIAGLAESNYGILMISSELVEVVGLCQRVYVMCEGEIAGELCGDEISEANIMRLAIPKKRKAA